MMPNQFTTPWATASQYNRNLFTGSQFATHHNKGSQARPPVELLDIKDIIIYIRPQESIAGQKAKDKPRKRYKYYRFVHRSFISSTHQKE